MKQFVTSLELATFKDLRDFPKLSEIKVIEDPGVQGIPQGVHWEGESSLE